MSVMFGVALGFWVATLHGVTAWTVEQVTTVVLTLGVVICIYWWYVNLGTLYPSRSILDYFLDFIMVIGLCSMSKSSGVGNASPLWWTIAWACVALTASVKAWFRAGPIRKPDHPLMVWAARVAPPVVLLLAPYAALLAYDAIKADKAVPTLYWVLTWLPVAAGIIVTVVVAYLPRPRTEA
jgi:hypothetical protein